MLASFLSLRAVGSQLMSSRPFIVRQLAVLASKRPLPPLSGQGDNVGAGEVTVLDLEDTEVR